MDDVNRSDHDLSLIAAGMTYADHEAAFCGNTHDL
jgi:hypothetical protein